MPYTSIFESIDMIETTWRDVILRQKAELIKIDEYLQKQYETYKDDVPIYPPVGLIFEAFNHFDFEDTKVVLMAQDCYINEGEAMGLCFSIPRGAKIPPSLKNIYKELSTDLNVIAPSHGDLTEWADQGVLLLNAALSVLAHNSNSHAKIWKKFTDDIIAEISDHLNNIVFILWGNFAQKKGKFINKDKHNILESRHPSPLGCGKWDPKTNDGVKTFWGCKHFSRTNDILANNGLVVDWTLSD